MQNKLRGLKFSLTGLPFRPEGLTEISRWLQPPVSSRRKMRPEGTLERITQKAPPPFQGGFCVRLTGGFTTG